MSYRKSSPKWQKIRKMRFQAHFDAKQPVIGVFHCKFFVKLGEFWVSSPDKAPQKMTKSAKNSYFMKINH